MLTGNAWGAGAAGAGAGLRAAPGTGWHPPGTAVVSSCQHDAGVSSTARGGYLEAIATEAQDLFRDYNILLDHF